MSRRYDLTAIADSLASSHPEVQELYLFGSRRFCTKSPRSDVDILIVCEGNIRPADLREFASVVCPALDLFLLRNGRATSSQNESFICADSTKELEAVSKP